MNRIFITLFVLLIVTFLSAFTQNNINLEIIYPKNNTNINAPSTFFMGNTNPESELTINNTRVKVYPNGGFVQVICLNRGTNTINISSKLGKEVKTLSYTINVPLYEKTIPNSPLRIDQSTVMPQKNFIYKEGDTIYVKFKGSTGNKASFSIGSLRDIPMKEQEPKVLKTDIGFNTNVQTSQEPVKGIYSGSYTIRPSDHFQDSIITIKLESGENVITQATSGKVSTINQPSPIIAEVIKDNAPVRTAPNESRLTPLVSGVRLYITGKIGNDYRFKLWDLSEGWIASSDIKLLPAGTPLPKSVFSSLTLDSDNEFSYIKIPLNEKLPFRIEQIPDSQMILTIYGAVADINLFPYNPNDKFIKEIKWIQQFSNTVQVIIKANSDQFYGYKYYYDRNTLTLALRKPPCIDKNSPLKGRIITLDPGHGGKESGSVGPTGVPEKNINLGIANYLREMLEASGTKVIMTRDADDKDVSLTERVSIANQNNSEILLSIHNNALPDGRDPYKSHGSSSYYYNSQALPLAKALQNAMVQNLGFKDFGILWDSLALTRPNEPLAVLVEIGFMTNPDEYNLLITPEFQKKSAEAIYKGLEDFYRK